MTDVSSGISVSPEILREKVAEIAQLDEQLDAASGSESAGKRAIQNALAAENEEGWRGVTDQLSAELNKYSDDVPKLVGLYSGITSTLSGEFKSKVDEFLAAEVKTRETNREQVSPEQISEWTEARKQLMEQYKALRGILELFEQDISGIEEPKKRSGARGPRGPRVLTGYDWFIDGEKRTDTQNSMSSIANTVCTPLGWKTADLRNWLTEQLGVDLENAPAEFEFTLPDPVNKKIAASLNPEKKAAIEAADMDSESDEESDNGD